MKRAAVQAAVVPTQQPQQQQQQQQRGGIWPLRPKQPPPPPHHTPGPTPGRGIIVFREALEADHTSIGAMRTEVFAPHLAMEHSIRLQGRIFSEAMANKEFIAIAEAKDPTSFFAGEDHHRTKVGLRRTARSFGASSLLPGPGY